MARDLITKLQTDVQSVENQAVKSYVGLKIYSPEHVMTEQDIRTNFVAKVKDILADQKKSLEDAKDKYESKKMSAQEFAWLTYDTVRFCCRWSWRASGRFAGIDGLDYLPFQTKSGGFVNVMWAIAGDHYDKDNEMWAKLQSGRESVPDSQLADFESRNRKTILDREVEYLDPLAKSFMEMKEWLKARRKSTIATLWQWQGICDSSIPDRGKNSFKQYILTQFDNAVNTQASQFDTGHSITSAVEEGCSVGFVTCAWHIDFGKSCPLESNWSDIRPKDNIGRRSPVTFTLADALAVPASTYLTGGHTVSREPVLPGKTRDNPPKDGPKTTDKPNHLPTTGKDPGNKPGGGTTDKDSKHHLSVTAKWVSPGMTDNYSIQEFPGRHVLPQKYIAHGNSVLQIHINTDQDPTKAVLQSLTIGNLSNKWTMDLPGDMLAKMHFDASGTCTTSLSDDDFFEGLSTTFNKNVLYCQVKVTNEALTAGNYGSNVLHIIRQKLILFIPGVCGSRIAVSSHPNDFAFLTRSTNPDSSPATWLRCQNDGTPMIGNDAVKVELLISYNGFPVYDVLNRPDMQEPSETIHLLRPDKRLVNDFEVVAWAYDWRLRLENAVDNLLGSGTAMCPSLVTVREKAKKSMPFLDDKVTIACHSTGGLITRGVLSHPEADKLVDHAYFIDVPFWGAPKAYNVFFTGAGMTDAGPVEIIYHEILRSLAPNLPIVYYLSPTAKFPGSPLLISQSGLFGTYSSAEVGQAMPRMIHECQIQNLYPTGSNYQWNKSLQVAAEKYHAGIITPCISWDKCLSFCSDRGKSSTISFLILSHGVLKLGYTSGDSTVPLISQIADTPASQVRMIPTSPVHSSAANEAFVWTEIRKSLQADKP